MKTAEAKPASVATSQKANWPFFSKEAEGSFFGESVNKEPSFFKRIPTYGINGKSVLQTKLTIGQPNDIYEKEADAMADKVVQRFSEPGVQKKSSGFPLSFGEGRGEVQRKCAHCEEEEKKKKGEKSVDKQIRRKPIFESNAGTEDYSLSFGEGRDEADKGGGNNHLHTTVGKLDNLLRKKFFCPPVAAAYASIGLKGEGVIGLTSIDKSSELMCVPKFDIDTKAGHGVLKKTNVSLKVNSKFSKQETEAPLGLKLEVPGCKTEAPAFVNISKDISDLAQVGEQEHCDDINLAFRQTLLPCSNELNKFTGQKFPGKNLDECYKSLVAKIGFDPIDCSEEFVNLSNKTEERDTQGFHDFDFKIISKDCKKVVTEFVKAKTNKVGDKSVAPDKWIPSSAKCAKPAPAPAKKPPTAPTQKPEVQKKCAACDNEEKLQTKMSEPRARSVAPSVENMIASSKGSGSPLPEATRAQMESSFGADFSNVRLHTNTRATEMNNDLNAHAFTHGRDIYFNSGKYDTTSLSGKHLLAHELTHVMQQTGDQIHRDDKTGETAKPQENKNDDATTVIPLKVPIVLNWDFTLPPIPQTPDYSETSDSLLALEIAKLEINKPSFIPVVESTDDRKDKSSFLKELTISFKPVLKYSIAKELNELAATGYTRNPIKGLPEPSADAKVTMKCFTLLLLKIKIHARQHFTRYDAVVATFKTDFIKAIENMPSSKKPYSMKKADMEAYITEFMLYQVALLQRKLWEDACAWEKQDYPNLLKNTCWGSLGGGFKPECGSAPQVPSPPALLITGKGDK